MSKSFWKPGEYEQFMGVVGSNIVSQKLVSRTHFKKSHSENGWSWYWQTRTPDEVDVVGDGAEGYTRMNKALNGFMSQQGVPEWNPDEGGMQSLPEGYSLQKISDDHYVVSKFVTYDDE